MTGGAERNFGEAWEVYLCEFERGTGAREIYSIVDQTNKVKTKKKKDLQFKNSHKFWLSCQILAIFHEFLSENQKKGLRPKSLMKSGVSPQNYENSGGKHQFGSLRPRFALQ